MMPRQICVHLAKSRGGVDEAFGVIVFDALAEAEDDLHAARADGGQVFVGEREVVARRLRGIGDEVREDGVDVHDVGVRPVAIVQAREGNAERAMLRGEVDQAAAHKRAFVDAVKRADGAVGLGEVDFERCGGERAACEGECYSSDA